MASTFKSLRELITDVGSAAAASTSKATIISSSPCLTTPSSGEPRMIREPSPTLISPDSSDTDSGQEEDQVTSKASKYRLSLEEVDELMGAIYDTLEIEEEETQLSRHDQMYEALGKKKARVFPIHKVLSDLVLKEWSEPDKKVFFPKSLKRRFPFDESPEAVWNKNPKLDAPLSKISKQADLAFEDMGHLKDPMDRRTDIVLKRAWDASMAGLKPALATSCVARNLEFWLSQLQEHLKAGTPRGELLKSFPMLFKATSFISDASTDSVKFAAKSAALSVAARRSVWMKTWGGDTASKTRLCSVPFTGDLVFGPELDSALERTADKKKTFPAKKKNFQRKIFRPFKEPSKPEKSSIPKKHWSGHKGKGKGGILFSRPNQDPKPQ
ncbi:lamina-associated polypeptide 2, isoforms alpha/zeta-like isoform X2 [Lithobates pipiens]